MLLRYNRVMGSSKIKTISNKLIKTIGDTFCVHGDTDDSLYLNQDWKIILQNELDKPYFINLCNIVKDEYCSCY